MPFVSAKFLVADVHLLCFDFNPGGDLPLRDFEATLGALFRRLAYRHLYDTVADAAAFGRLVDAGWFPFAEINK